MEAVYQAEVLRRSNDPFCTCHAIEHVPATARSISKSTYLLRSGM